jgi:hypothetical protein
MLGYAALLSWACVCHAAPFATTSGETSRCDQLDYLAVRSILHSTSAVRQSLSLEPELVVRMAREVMIRDNHHRLNASHIRSVLLNLMVEVAHALDSDYCPFLRMSANDEILREFSCLTVERKISQTSSSCLSHASVDEWRANQKLRFGRV